MKSFGVPDGTGFGSGGEGGKFPHTLPAGGGRQGIAPPQVAADRMVSAAFLCGGEQEVFRASAAKTSAT